MTEEDHGESGGMDGRSGNGGEIAALDGDQSTDKIRGNGRRSSVAGRSRSRRKITENQEDTDGEIRQGGCRVSL